MVRRRLPAARPGDRSTFQRWRPPRVLESMPRRAILGVIPRRRSARRQPAKSSPLSACSLTGRRCGRPGRPRGPMIAGTASTTCSNSNESWVLAADNPTARGMPVASISRWYLEPALPRSTGLAPVSSPHAGPARSRCQWRPGTSRPGWCRRASPAADDAAAPTLRPVASRGAAASRSRRCCSPAPWPGAAARAPRPAAHR
jgi:hypothetical protein